MNIDFIKDPVLTIRIRNNSSDGHCYIFYAENKNAVKSFKESMYEFSRDGYFMGQFEELNGIENEERIAVLSEDSAELLMTIANKNGISVINVPNH